MSYYRRSYSTSRPSRPIGPRANQYDAKCETCGKKVPAHRGILTGGRASGWTVRHTPRVWKGSPISGQWVGGCEEFENTPDYTPPSRKTTAYTSTGARMTSRYGRCEDAPCCGCCD